MYNFYLWKTPGNWVGISHNLWQAKGDGDTRCRECSRFDFEIDNLKKRKIPKNVYTVPKQQHLNYFLGYVSYTGTLHDISTFASSWQGACSSQGRAIIKQCTGLQSSSTIPVQRHHRTPVLVFPRNQHII